MSKEELDFGTNEGNDIYQFEQMDVDILMPQLNDIKEEVQQDKENEQIFNIDKQIETLKQTYIFRQKLPSNFINTVRGKNGGRKEKKLRTMNFYSSPNNLRKQKQNIEMLVEERKNKQYLQKLFLLHELRMPFQCTIEVEKQGMFNSQPIYRLFNTKDSKFLLACQKQSIISNKFIFSLNQKRISAQQRSYFGQLVSLDFLNSQWILYDSGFNSSRVRQLDQCRAQLLYARYDQNCMGISDTSKIKIIAPSNLKQLSEYKPLQGSENLLSKYAKYNSQKIVSYKYQRNRIKQQFQKRLFDIPSSNGFIIVPNGSTTPLLYFGKKSQGKYCLQIHPPLSILQSFALCILHLKLT